MIIHYLFSPDPRDEMLANWLFINDPFQANTFDVFMSIYRYGRIS